MGICVASHAVRVGKLDQLQAQRCAVTAELRTFEKKERKAQIVLIK